MTKNNISSMNCKKYRLKLYPLRPKIVHNEIHFSSHESGPPHLESNIGFWNHFALKNMPQIIQWTMVVLLLSVIREANSAVTFDYVPGPEFVEKPTDLNVTSYIDQTTRLPCTVRHLGTKRVSWIRGRDLQVLSSGRTTFASDIRTSILPGTKQTKRNSKRSLAQLNQPTGVYNYNIFTNNKTATNVYKNPSLRRTSSRHLQRTKRQYYEEKSTFPNSRWTPIERRPPKEKPSSFKPYNADGNYFYNFSDVIPQRFTSGLNYNDVFFNYAFANSYRNLRNESATFVQLVTTSDDMSYPNVAAPTRSPIEIHPSSTKVATVDVTTRKRTVVPYNYLDEIWEPEDFTLQIKFTKPSDAGTYICQVNTEPRMTQVIRLKVIDMVAKIAGPKELFVKEESPVLLICKVTHGANLPGFIFWFKNGHLVDYDSSNGRIKVDTTSNGRSKLLLKKAVREDSANYTCAPAGGHSDSTVLTVIIDERPAAMQKGSGSYLHSSFLLIGPILCILMASLEDILLFIHSLLYS